MTNRYEREAAITANALSPVRTPAVLAAMSEVELKNLEIHLKNLEAADPYGKARKTVPRTAQAADDPNYTPYGAAPSGYGILPTNLEHTLEINHSSRENFFLIR